MSLIPPPVDSTVKRIFDSWTTMRPARHSRRLGASQIGKACDRALWYSFRWARLTAFDGRMLRLFEKGHVEEACVLNELKRIGVDVRAVDPATGEQWEFFELSDHLVCKLDGAGVGFVEAPEAWHVIEVKTANQASFDKIAKDGCRKAKPEHYAQCMVGMGMSGMLRAAYIVINKNTDEIYLERLRFDKREYQQLLQRAKEIVFATEPPDKLNDSPAWWECKFCDYHHICHDCGGCAERNCRTCKNATALESGGWVCKKSGMVIDGKNPCNLHEFMPGMVCSDVQKACEMFGGTVA